MYTIDLGKQSNSTSTLKIKGLPPLKLKIHKNGYFDGWITYAEDREHIWLASQYEQIEQISRKLSKQTPKAALQNCQTGDLAVLKMINSWERALILERTDTNRAKVYLIDNGATKDVDINHLYPMNKELRQVAPLVFPVSIDPSEPSYGEIPKRDWLALQGVRVAVKIGRLTDSTISCSKFTVFDAESGANLPFLTAAAARKNRFQRAIEDEPTTVRLPTVAPHTYSPTPPPLQLQMTSTHENTTVAVNNNKLIALIAICSASILIFGLVVVLLALYLKKRKQNNLEEERRDPSPVDIATQRRVLRVSSTPNEPQYREDDPLELEATTVATLIATMGHGKYEAERRSRGNKELEKESTDQKEETQESGTTANDRQAGGRSASLRYSDGSDFSSSGVYSRSYRAEVDSQPTYTVPHSSRNHELSYWDLTRRGTDRTQYTVKHPELSSIYSEHDSESTNHNASTQRTANSYDSSSDPDTSASTDDVEATSEISDISEVREILRSFEAQKSAVYTDELSTSADSRAGQLQKKKRNNKMVVPMPTLNETLDSYYSANSEPCSDFF